jgi:calcineurin-like phosphoesterase family protein
MKNYFTSDTHFFHRNIIDYCQRPYADEIEMNKALVENWNSIITPADDVYHLGDFAFGDMHGVDSIMNQLNFRHLYFIKGNHDRPFCNWLSDNRYGNSSIAKRVSLFNGFVETKIEGYDFVLCHYAMRVWNKSHRGVMHLYGHSHGTLPDDPNSKSFDVGIDCHNYKPLSLEQVLDIMNTKNTEQNFENLPGVKAGIIRE